MTALWLILIAISIVAIIYAIFSKNIPLGIAGGIICLIAVICFFAVPVRGYMDVDSTHWFWTVDVMQFKQINEYGTTGNHSSRSSAYDDAKRHIPSDAYNVSIDVDSHIRTKTHTDQDGHSYTTHETYYDADYSYWVDRWTKVSEVSVCGRDKEPYEPERPYPTEAPNTIGTFKCSAGHNEHYTVTGVVDGVTQTYDVKKSDWENISDYDEFSYKKFRFGDEIWDLQFAR